MNLIKSSVQVCEGSA